MAEGPNEKWWINKSRKKNPQDKMYEGDWTYGARIEPISKQESSEQAEQDPSLMQQYKYQIEMRNQLHQAKYEELSKLWNTANANIQQTANNWAATYIDVNDEEKTEEQESVETAPKRILPVSEVVLIKGEHFSKADIEMLSERLNAIVVPTTDLTGLTMLDLDELQEKIDEARAKHDNR